MQYDQLCHNKSNLSYKMDFMFLLSLQIDHFSSFSWVNGHLQMICSLVFQSALADSYPAVRSRTHRALNFLIRENFVGILFV
jgi:hypothetical protein